MIAHLFLKGWLIGFLIAIPVGPIGLLCIQHSLIRGMIYGLIAGLGAALADTLYGALACCGVSILSDFLSHHQLWIQLFGSLFLCVVGLKKLLSAPLTQQVSSGSTRIFITTFLLTLTNPFTLLSFVGIYAGLGIGLQGEGIVAKLILTIGVFLGSCFWWSILCFGASKVGKKIPLSTTLFLNRLAGIMIFCFGLLILIPLSLGYF